MAYGQNEEMADPDGAARKTGTQAIERAISILRLFAYDDEPQSLTNVARTVGLSTATTHRILASLVRERLLTYDGAVERYRIGPDAVFLFAAGARRYGITAARHELDDLVRCTRETAALGVLDGTDTIIVLQSESDLPLRFSRPVGTRVPVHVSAMGKAILVNTSVDLRACVDALGELHRYTDDTITERDQLIEELELVRERGWAVNDNERYDGVRAVAVPVRDGDTPVRAAVGIQGPATRLPDARLDEVVAALREAAARLARHLDITF